MGWFLAPVPCSAPNRLDSGDAASNDSVPSLIGYARMASTLKNWARSITRDVHALYLGSNDPRVPWYAKLLAVAVAGYALSPIHLIPDHPGSRLSRRPHHRPSRRACRHSTISAEVMADHRATAAAAQQRPVSRKVPSRSCAFGSRLSQQRVGLPIGTSPWMTSIICTSLGDGRLRKRA